MPRQKDFDRHIALTRAMRVFWDKGYAGTSMTELLTAMEIGRQSLYDTFGDKRALYLEALRLYCDDSISELLRSLQGDSPLAAIANMLLRFSQRPQEQNSMGCMGVNAISEFGCQDASVNALRENSGRMLNHALEQLLRQAQLAGEISPKLDVTAGAAFLGSTLAGMKISAKAGATAVQLSATANFAVKALKME